MEVQVENPGGLRRDLHVTVAAERFDKAVNARLQRIARSVRIPGFRPGKAPMAVVARRYGDQAREEAIGDLLAETWPAALEQSGLSVAGSPEFELKSAQSGQDLQYVGHVEVFPEITLKGLDRIRVRRPKVEVTEEDVDRLIASLRKSRQQMVAVERAAGESDSVRIDFVGRIDGEAFDGGSGKDVTVEIGGGRFLPDLEQALVGRSAGEQFTADVHFPEDYQAESLRGRTAQFEITVHEVLEPRLPEIDEEFLKAHGVDPAAGEQGLRDKCREALDREARKAARARVKSQILDQLMEHNPIEVPQSLVAEEIPRLRAEAARRFGADKLPEEQQAQMLPDALFAASAERRVALGLLIGAVIKEREIKADAQRVSALIDEIAADYEHPDQVRKFYESNPQLLQGVRAMVLEEQVVDSLLESARVEDEPMSLDALLNPAAQSGGENRQSQE